MKKTILALSITAALVALSGCSSFKVGAACYIPHGVTGQCSMATMAPVEAPAVAITPRPAAAAQQPAAPRQPAPGA